MDQPLQLLQATISMENASVGRDTTPRNKQPKETGKNNKKMLLNNPCSESTNGTANNSVTLQAFRLEKPLRSWSKTATSKFIMRIA